MLPRDTTAARISDTRRQKFKVRLSSILDLSRLNAKVDAPLDRFWRDLALRRKLIGFFDYRQERVCRLKAAGVYFTRAWSPSAPDFVKQRQESFCVLIGSNFSGLPNAFHEEGKRNFLEVGTFFGESKFHTVD